MKTVSDCTLMLKMRCITNDFRNIKKENDIKKVLLEDMEQLAQEIREFLLEH